ncbi:MAG: EAL domain-containing protein [Deltaproteobacteria bacterium]|nr:EAL domain-containing protein [Deltaproteobacteria bacterium]
MSGIVRVNRALEGGTVAPSGPWVLIISASSSTGEWLAERVRADAPVHIVESATQVAGAVTHRGRPALVIVDLDRIDREPIRLLWELAQLCPTAARLLLAAPGTRGHADAQAFADPGDLLLDLPCSRGQIEIALAHMLGAALRPVVPLSSARGPINAAPRVEAAWRVGRAASCWSVDFSAAFRLLGPASYDSLFAASQHIVARALAESFPGLVEVLATAPIDRECIGIVVAHASPRGELAPYVARVERDLDTALRRDPAIETHGHPMALVSAAPVAITGPGLAAASIAAALDDASGATLSRRRQMLDDERLRLVSALDAGLAFAFEPIVDLDTGEAFAYRATWSSPLADAHDLEALASSVGLLDRCDEAMLRGMLRAARQLEPRWRLLVRVSGPWLLDPRRIQRASRWVREVGLVPAQVVLEIDDASALRGGPARELLEPVLREGFGLAFACHGASKLTFDDIARISPDLITLPSSWVRGLATSRVRREFVGAVRRLAAALDIATIATGADTIDEVAALCELGVRYTAGKIFGRPWVDFAVPRPRGLKQLAAVWAGQAHAPPPPALRFDEDSGEPQTELRPAESARFAHGTSPVPLTTVAAMIDMPAMPPLHEMFAGIDAWFERTPGDARPAR